MSYQIDSNASPAAYDYCALQCGQKTYSETAKHMEVTSTQTTVRFWHLHKLPKHTVSRALMHICLILCLLDVVARSIPIIHHFVSHTEFGAALAALFTSINDYLRD